jgi:hypothetical protein
MPVEVSSISHAGRVFVQWSRQPIVETYLDRDCNNLRLLESFQNECITSNFENDVAASQSRTRQTFNDPSTTRQKRRQLPYSNHEEHVAKRVIVRIECSHGLEKQSWRLQVGACCRISLGVPDGRRAVTSCSPSSCTHSSVYLARINDGIQQRNEYCGELW